MAALNYSQTLDYLYAVLPMFQRIGAAAYKRDLDNTIKLCEALGNPQHKFQSIHVAGTNGKGSSCHMIAAILQSAGYKTGLYTSPHLKEFTERIKINGVEIPQEFVVDFVERIKPHIEEIKPSFFEITVVMAFDYFVNQGIDYGVIEVGLGGRLDSTNVVNPLVALITNISFDHKDLLGETLLLIAAEKAGIIKNDGIVVIGERQEEVAEVFIRRAELQKAKILFAQDEYQVNESGEVGFEVKELHQLLFEDLVPDLKGTYQKKNIPGVLSVISQLRLQGLQISNDAIMEGIENTIGLTGLKGRWQKLSEDPLTYCDVGHNEDGIMAVLESIEALDYVKLHFVIGVVKDKEVRAVLRLLPREATYYFCQASVPRALDASTLKIQANEMGLAGSAFPNVMDAYNEARKHANKDDLIFIGGSTFVVAELDGL
ncbi:MAG: folylpolyglutamate synthase/dihydrofolate synthase family protein [Cyclobacteriaceae bacterium]